MSGEPFPHESHSCVGEPELVYLTHLAMRRCPGATVEEIVEEVFALARWDRVTAYDRRTTSSQIRDIIAESRLDEYPSIDEIEAMRATLPEGRNGTLSIAKALHTSESTVKRRLRTKR